MDSRYGTLLHDRQQGHAGSQKWEAEGPQEEGEGEVEAWPLTNNTTVSTDHQQLSHGVNRIRPEQSKKPETLVKLPEPLTYIELVNHELATKNSKVFACA